MAERLLQTMLVNSLVFAALFAAVALVRASLGRRLSAGLSLALWAVLAVKLLLPFGFQSALSPLAWLRPAAPMATAQPATTAATVTGTLTSVGQSSGSLAATAGGMPLQSQAVDPEQGSGIWQWSGQLNGTGLAGSGDALPGTADAASQPASAASAFWSRVSWVQWVLLAWASGAMGVALWLGLGQVALRRHLRSALPPPPQAVQALRDCCRELGIRRPMGLRLLRGGGSPAIAGLLRPVVLLDEELVMGDVDFCGTSDRRLSGDDRRDATTGNAQAHPLRPVLLHELSHYRCGDLWAIHGLNLLTVVYWFHPLVWALAALARRDMETRCDQRVLERLAREDQRGYVNTLLHFAGYGRALQTQAVLGMGVTRRTMERRIRDMFRSRRSDGLARCVAVGCAALMLCVGLLTACTAPTGTPDLAGAATTLNSATAAATPAAASAMPAPDATTAPTVTVPAILAVPIDAPAATATAAPPHRTQSYSGAEGTVTITVDADILQPDGPMPIVRLAPQGFPMEQVRQISQVLFDGQTAYEHQAGLTKAQLQTEIDKCQDFIGDWDKLVAYYGGGKEGEATARDVTKDFTQRIKGYQKQLATAPDSIPRKPTDWAFHPSDYYKDTVLFPSDATSRNTQQIWMEADLDGGCLGEISASNLSSSTLEWHAINFWMGSARDGAGNPRWNPADTRPMTLSADQAAAMVQGKLEAMGIQGYVLGSLSVTDKEGKVPSPADAGNTQTVYGYNMTFVPTYGGIPEAVGSYGATRDKAAVGPDYAYQWLNVRVVNDRIVTFYWNSPTQTVQTEDADAPLLPLDDILASFQTYTQSTITRGWLTHEDSQSPTYKETVSKMAGGGVKITRIELVLYRMRDKEHKLTYRTMPVWRFYGQQSTRYTDGTAYDFPDGQARLIATFNAVDGSLFNEYLGY